MKLSFGDSISEDQYKLFSSQEVLIPGSSGLAIKFVLRRSWKWVDVSKAKIEGTGPELKVLKLFIAENNQPLPRVVVYLVQKPKEERLRDWMRRPDVEILDAQAGKVEGREAAHLLTKEGMGFGRLFMTTISDETVAVVAGSCAEPKDLEELSFICASAVIEQAKGH